MAYILAAERDGSPADMLENFRRYREYLAQVASRFPARAHALATSDWFYDFRDHRCPHDAWLESLSITEPAAGVRGEQRQLTIAMRLLGAYHDGHIEIRYPVVFSYRLDTWDGMKGHRDWRYDEFRLSDQGHLLHEIEWAGAGSTGRWLIEASDVEYQWKPLQAE